MKKDDNKKAKKIIVNSLTLSRVAGTIIMPFLFNSLSTVMFITVIAIILFTDFLDGALARHWGVSTIFGSVADMTADKMFGISILIILSRMYPSMAIPLALETIIAGINVIAAKQGSIGKSSELGRIKTWVIGLSMCALLLTGLSPELITSLENISFGGNIIEGVKKTINFMLNNKQTIESVAKTAAITSEVLVASDYAIKSIKNPDRGSKNYKLSEYIKNKKYRDYIKKVWLDENYYKETKEVPILEKLIPPEYREEVKVKKLTFR